MRRRKFIALLGGSAVAWPLAIHAQRLSLPVIGFLNGRSASASVEFLTAFRKGLGETQYFEGVNVLIEYRWAEGRYDQLPGLAADLVDRRVAVIAAGGGPGAAIAAKASTATIPIVFVAGSNPIGAGLVTSINRPGGNVTGILNIASSLTAKRLELLREFAPTTKTIAVLRNPNYAEVVAQTKEIQEAARQFELNVLFVEASSDADFERALSDVVRERVNLLFVGNDPFFASRRNKLAALLAHHKIMAIYSQREYVVAGGLMSYGTNFSDVYRQGGVYTGRILKGEKPADLPVVQPTRFEFVINLKTARELGIDIPTKLLALADEVLE